MKAIILAAGLGKRLQEVLKGQPKPLFELNGKALLEYSIEILLKNGIEKIIIVIGYNGHLIKEKIYKSFNDPSIIYIENPIYGKTGSMHSLFSALKKPEDCLVLDGDIIYHHDIIPLLINNNEKNSVILSDLSGGGDEVYVVLDKNKKVTYLGKQHPGKRNIFEFIGISKFSKEFIGKMFELHRENFENENFDEYYEDCAYRTSKFMPWRGLVIKDLPWSEVDKKEDIERAKKVLKNL